MSDNKEIKNTIEIMKNKSIINQESNENLGLTKEYNKINRDKLWDCNKAKKNYKESTFENRNTYLDPISNKVLHKNQKSAQNKYHMKNKSGENISTKWSSYSAEVDHITSLKEGHSYVKNNPFLSDSDFKEIMNSKNNFRILSKRDNVIKGEKSDWHIIMDKKNNVPIKARVYIAKQKIGSDITLKKKFTIRTAKNMGTEFYSGAKEALIMSAIPLTAEAVRNLSKVAMGKKSFDEAAKDMGKTIIDVSMTGGMTKLAADYINNKLKDSKNETLANLAKNNKLSQVFVIASIAKESAMKYINGEIDEIEFINEVGEKGLTIMSGMIGGAFGREVGMLLGGAIGTAINPGTGTFAGMALGRAVGEFIGAIVASAACSAVISGIKAAKYLNNYKLKENQLNFLENQAIKEIEKQRETFKNLVQDEYNYWDKEISEGFNMMLGFACEEAFNLEGVTNGLDKILQIFGKSVAFKTIDEYENQLDKPLKLSF
ncbi:protein of unknown function [Acetoanaerobium sticklandii]|uniref:Uncharacterized protein n=1 Tax=Acetoanaerobium sticklandii (strain ATCC 12662 / DSM 519 / JCM 1433 / CCUG 9281 / NCIMB 10654 / HF) TaxID=499177 RepID=E3PY82_ACESD|nr:hypothetical protein [Acetoanaerobium sticklandii]CBH21397.1 protein of unknown function [Acetoanaerobium sticklandii]